ncbi:MAG: Arginine-tRNA ligase [Parcubacteria group bacterium GW2011_GWA1_42_7]|nr:MAG: Arginine-tRNA ligase [Parcubacteria group bacterium GW2011_GWB1_42_6]KKS69152.1 MAG: Arginine-tRNA ligase [Parcubacteria group bacterium GW2011_GWA1_42_7]KKS91941.1 MAG: Arginine-tRNA ligase [Parcubacteria group bacterium GW2011_GWC1_43_12]
MIRDQIKQLINIPEAQITRVENGRFGDYSTNIALKSAKVQGGNPLEAAEEIKGKILSAGSDLIEKVEVAGPGFINIFISPKFLRYQVKEIMILGEKYGFVDSGKGKKIQIEFISANPTGPLTLGNGRGGFLGDVLANVLARANWKVEREYYVNDSGEQVRKLGKTLTGEEIFYKGDYIEDLRKRIETKDFQQAGEKAAGIVLSEMIKPTIHGQMKIDFDNWFSEKSLYESGEVEQAIDLLNKKGFVCEKENAWWFKSSELGDEKDRVLIKADGQKTYLASDIAYLKNKFDRGFDRLVMIWGADHHGYINRIKAAAKALGYDENKIDFIIVQLARLIEDGKEVKMSKRAGVYVTLDELIEEVGADVARFFFLTRSPETHLNFDLKLAKEQSEKNPVYYIQYAFARISSILKKAVLAPMGTEVDLSVLNHSSELALIKYLIRLPEMVEDSARDLQVQRLTQYSLDLVRSFHKFYEDCRVISEDEKLSQARLELVQATKTVLKNTLDILGIGAPEKM